MYRFLDRKKKEIKNFAIFVAIKIERVDCKKNKTKDWALVQNAA